MTLVNLHFHNYARGAVGARRSFNVRVTFFRRAPALRCREMVSSVGDRSDEHRRKHGDGCLAAYAD